MIITYLLATAAFFIGWSQWRLVTAWLFAGIPFAAFVIEQWGSLGQGEGTLIVTILYTAALMIDYRLVRKDLL